MKKTGIFYGSSTGTCEDVAGRIAVRLGVDSADVHNVADMTAGMIEDYDVLLLGSSTWGCGDLQDDWYDALKLLQQTGLKGKTVALFGCGDSESYGYTFCDAVGVIYDGLKDSGCTFAGGGVAVDDYSFDSSSAVVDGSFVGLPIDEVNESDRTDARIEAWAEALRPAME